jgi:hypothetical protein
MQIKNPITPYSSVGGRRVDVLYKHQSLQVWNGLTMQCILELCKATDTHKVFSISTKSECRLGGERYIADSYNIYMRVEYGVLL